MIEVLFVAHFHEYPFKIRGSHSQRLIAYLRRMKLWALERRAERFYGKGVVS